MENPTNSVVFGDSKNIANPDVSCPKCGGTKPTCCACPEPELLAPPAFIICACRAHGLDPISRAYLDKSNVVHTVLACRSIVEAAAGGTVINVEYNHRCDLGAALQQAAIEAHVGFQHPRDWAACDLAICEERKLLFNRVS